MKVYEVSADWNRYRNAELASVEDLDRLRFDGSPTASSWLPLSIVWAEDQEDLPPANFTMFAGCPLFDRVATKALGDVLSSAGELLPLNGLRDRGYSVFNVTNVIDALDESGSAVSRFETDGRIFQISSYEMKPLVREEGVSLFKVRSFCGPGSPLLATEDFVREVKKAKLTGFVFRKVWASS